MSHPQSIDLATELTFQFSRSGGPGGQNVNKVNSKVTLRFDVKNSQVLNEDQKAVLLHKLPLHMTDEGIVLITSQESRSQLQNKEIAVAKFDDLLKKAFTPVKKRRPTKPTKAAKRKRVEGKKLRGEKKKWRQKPE